MWWWSGSQGVVNNEIMLKIESARLLILGIEGVLPGEMLPVSLRALAEAGTPEAAKDRQIQGAALTRVVLYAIVIELVVKHLWEEEHGTNAKYTHNVHELFGELKPETQRQIKTIYDACCHEYETAVQAGKQQHGPEAVAVNMANLEEALQWNEKAVKDFKYDMTPRGRSVPTGMFWDSEHLWVVPPGFKNFAIEVTHWASHQGEYA